MEKGENAQNEQFHLFPQCFSLQSVSINPIIATFQFLSSASLNLGWSQNILGNGLTVRSLLHDIVRRLAEGSRVAQWLSVWLVNQWSWVRAALDYLGFFHGSVLGPD